VSSKIKYARDRDPTLDHKTWPLGCDDKLLLLVGVHYLPQNSAEQEEGCQEPRARKCKILLSLKRSFKM